VKAMRSRRRPVGAPGRGCGTGTGGLMKACARNPPSFVVREGLMAPPRCPGAVNPFGCSRGKGECVLFVRLRGMLGSIRQVCGVWCVAWGMAVLRCARESVAAGHVRGSPFHGCVSCKKKTSIMCSRLALGCIHHVAPHPQRRLPRFHSTCKSLLVRCR